VSAKHVIISGVFDDLRFEDFRFFEEASKLGDSLNASIWSDDVIEAMSLKPPKFPEAEREYLLRSIRWIKTVFVTSGHLHKPDRSRIHVTPSDFPQELLRQVPPSPQTPVNPRSSRKKVVVTGCFDWFHSGHVRFFEECSELGDLYVVVGHDENIRLLKGEGHPLFPATQRRYMASAIRFVTQALISTGEGWMDAEPEFLAIRPDIYAVNEDGDKPEKRAFCDRHGIEYRVLRRLPRAGLPRRESTALRGF
jgi:cytidyltransferase-like protein